MEYVWDEFKELYSKLPGDKPLFEYVWRLTGGNPNTLSQLYQVNWNVELIIKELIRGKGISRDFISRWGKWLEVIVDDPNVISSTEFPEELKNKLIEGNLIIYDIYFREPELWIDEPPKKDLDIGVGDYVAWQTPLHIEVVRKHSRYIRNSIKHITIKRSMNMLNMS